MVANDCGVIPQMLPNKWTFENFAECPSKIPINLLILYKISLTLLYYL